MENEEGIVTETWEWPEGHPDDTGNSPDWEKHRTTETWEVIEKDEAPEAAERVGPEQQPGMQD